MISTDNKFCTIIISFVWDDPSFLHVIILKQSKYKDGPEAEPALDRNAHDGYLGVRMRARCAWDRLARRRVYPLLSERWETRAPPLRGGLFRERCQGLGV